MKRTMPLTATVLILLTFALPGMGLRSATAGPTPSVTSAKGLAYNYFTNVSLFDGPYNRRGYGQPSSAPAEASSPAVVCPAQGGSASVTDRDGTRAQYGPAVIFGGKWPDNQDKAPPSGPLTSSLDCRYGDGGYVTASTSVTLMPPGSAYPGGAGPGPFIADEVHSTCTVGADGSRSASTTVNNGILETSYDKNTQKAKTTERVPTQPQPNYTRQGTIDHVGDSYRIVFNQQITNRDGSVTVNAAHMYLLGPTAKGDLIIGSSTCGPLTATTTTTTPTTRASASAAAPITSPTAASAAATPTPKPKPSGSRSASPAPTPSSSATTGGAPGASAAAQGPLAIGRASGYFTRVSLFGGPSAAKGPAPMVALPSDGSVDPVTANSTSGVAQYGPALIFQSGQIAVSTQGTPGTGSVTSSARITGLPDGPGPFRYKQVSSTCTATDQGPTGAASIGGGVLETKYDVKTQEPVKTVDLPASPAVGAEYTGTIDHVGDHYKIVFNEQSTNPDGSLTVNAAHMYLLGPIAKGEMIIGQSVCGVRGATAGGSATAAPTRSVAAAVRTRSTVLPVALGGAALAVLASVLFVVRRRRGSALTDADGD